MSSYLFSITLPFSFVIVFSHFCCVRNSRQCASEMQITRPCSQRFWLSRYRVKAQHLCSIPALLDHEARISWCLWIQYHFRPNQCTFPWRRKWQPTPVFLPGKSHEQRSMVGYSPWGRKRVRYNLLTEQQQMHLYWWASRSSPVVVEAQVTYLTKIG